MSLGLIKPGMVSVTRTHPKTGQPILPLYMRENGSVVWPALGASPDDPDDPKFTGEEDDDEEDDEDEKLKPKKDDEDEDEDKPTRPERQAARYRVQLRETRQELDALKAEMRANQDKDKKPDEIVTRDLTEAKEKVTELTTQNRDMRLELAFFKSNTVDWVDPTDALRLLDLSEIDVDEDGMVDAKQLRAALKELAKRKPHLVKTAKVEPPDDDEDEDDDEPSTSRSAPKLNGRRKGTREDTSRAALAKKFPVLR